MDCCFRGNDPPQADASGGMGVGGLKSIVGMVMAGFKPTLSVPHLDSRFRENDMPLKYNRRKRRWPAERLPRIALTLA